MTEAAGRCSAKRLPMRDLELDSADTLKRLSLTFKKKKEKSIPEFGIVDMTLHSPKNTNELLILIYGKGVCSAQSQWLGKSHDASPNRHSDPELRPRTIATTQ